MIYSMINNTKSSPCWPTSARCDVADILSNPVHVIFSGRHHLRTTGEIRLSKQFPTGWATDDEGLDGLATEVMYTEVALIESENMKIKLKWCTPRSLIKSENMMHCFRWWLGAEQAPSHYLNQWWYGNAVHINGPLWGEPQVIGRLSSDMASNYPDHS